MVGPMTAPLFGGDNSAPSTSATNWNYIVAQSQSNYSATESARAITLSAAMTLSSLYVQIDTAPGGAASYTFTVYKNGIATALTAAISGTNTSATDSTDSVSFAAGDTISMGVTPANTPAAITMSMWNMQATASSFQQIMGAHSSSLNTTAPLYFGVNSTGTAATTQFASQSDAAMVIAAAGTLSLLNLTLSGTPGSGQSYAATLELNGADSALVATVADTNTTNTDATHSINVLPGDVVSLKITPTGTPTARSPKWCMVFTPTTNGESIFGYGSNAAPSNTAANYEQPLGVGGAGWASTESSRNNLIPGGFTLKRLYVSAATAPGGSASYTYTMRASGVNTLLTTTMTGSATTANVNADVDISQGQQMTIGVVPATTPIPPAGVHIGYAMTVTPAGGSGGGGGGASTTAANFFAFFK